MKFHRYGPLWIYMTLTILIAAAGNLSSYLNQPVNCVD